MEHANASGNTSSISGTAFYIKRDDDLFLVTNRHNLDAPMKDIKYAGYKPVGIKLSGYFDGEHLGRVLINPARWELLRRMTLRSDSE